MQCSFIKNVKEHSVLFIKKAKNARMLRSFQKNVCPTLAVWPRSIWNKHLLCLRPSFRAYVNKIKMFCTVTIVAPCWSWGINSVPSVCSIIKLTPFYLFWGQRWDDLWSYIMHTSLWLLHDYQKNKPKHNILNTLSVFLPLYCNMFIKKIYQW